MTLRHPHPKGRGSTQRLRAIDVGFRTAAGRVITADRLATTAPGVYAAGDVTGRMPFTHAAGAMGRVAARNALGHRGRARFSAAAIPWVVVTDRRSRRSAPPRPRCVRVMSDERPCCMVGNGRLRFWVRACSRSQDVDAGGSLSLVVAEVGRRLVSSGYRADRGLRMSERLAPKGDGYGSRYGEVVQRGQGLWFHRP